MGARDDESPWWGRFRLESRLHWDVGSVCPRVRRWFSTGELRYEREPLREGKFTWHNWLVSRISEPMEPSQHDVARLLTKTTVGRQGEIDEETGLSKCETGLLLLAAHLDGRGFPCRVLGGKGFQGYYLAVPYDMMTGTQGRDFARKILGEIRGLHTRLQLSPDTLTEIEPKQRIYR